MSGETTLELLPCPVCGKERHNVFETSYGVQNIECSDGKHSVHAKGPTFAEVLANWNRRAYLTASLPEDVAPLVLTMRGIAKHERDHKGHNELAALLEAACDALARQSDEIAALREALAPFEDVDGEGVSDHPDDTKAVLKVGRQTYYALTLGDFRRARAALSPMQEVGKNG